MVRSRLTRRITIQYFVSVIVYVFALMAAALLAWRVCAMFRWQETDPLYRLLRWVADYILLWIGLLVLVGWVGITYYFFRKILRYLDQVVDASERLASPTEEPIVLSDDLKVVQDELNALRERSRRSAEEAREAEQRKNDLIVYLAHDLKTPLTSVIGYLTLLRDEPQLSQENRAKYTGIALDKAERLEELINEFFDITRFSLSHLTLSRERVDLSLMLEQICYEFRPLLAEKGLEFSLSLAPHVELLCDPDKLERVFDNLLRNAVNYSYAGTAIAVGLAREGDAVCVSVSNRGRTIPPEKLERVFEQFFRLDASRGSAGGGAGLGLAIAREIVELHGGSIRAESRDETIRFTVRLPLDGEKNVSTPS